MKFKEINTKSKEELKALEGKLREELFQSKMDIAASKNANTAKVTSIKKDVARVLTALRGTAS